MSQLNRTKDKARELRIFAREILRVSHTLQAGISWDVNKEKSCCVGRQLWGIKVLALRSSMTSQIEEGDGEWEPMARDGVLTPGCRWSILSSEDSVQVQNDEWVTEVDWRGGHWS